MGALFLQTIQNLFIHNYQHFREYRRISLRLFQSDAKFFHTEEWEKTNCKLLVFQLIQRKATNIGQKNVLVPGNIFRVSLNFGKLGFFASSLIFVLGNKIFCQFQIYAKI
jgi:hypothetical protein